MIQKRKKPAGLDFWEDMLKDARAHAKRALNVEIQVSGDWQSYKLIDNGECIYAWSDQSPGGVDLAYWLAFEHLPFLHGLGASILRRPPPVGPARRINAIAHAVLEEMMNAGKDPNSRSFLRAFQRAVGKRIKEIGDDPKRREGLPPRFQGPADLDEREGFLPLPSAPTLRGVLREKLAADKKTTVR